MQITDNGLDTGFSRQDKSCELGFFVLCCLNFHNKTFKFGFCHLRLTMKAHKFGVLLFAFDKFSVFVCFCD